MSDRPVAHVYVDALNLYYGMLKGHQGRKWLNLEVWADRLLPSYDVRRIVYCTARVTPFPNDPNVHVRQDAYLQALGSLPRVDIIEGNFAVKPRRGLRIAATGCTCCEGTGQCCQCCSQVFAKVQAPEEKGSDVNVAVQLVRDAYRSEYDAALVVSNDSDLKGAIDVVRADLGKTIIVASSVHARSAALRGDEHRKLRPAGIEQSQMLPKVLLADGRTVVRPNDW